MATYKLDGKYIYSRSSRIGEIDGKYIRDSHGSRLGEIDGNFIRDSRGSRVAEIDGNNIRDSRGSRIGSMDDVRKIIDGPGGIALVALWVLLVR
jgi:sporulation protein YlmC with PRC-barrel domain